MAVKVPKSAENGLDIFAAENGKEVVMKIRYSILRNVIALQKKKEGKKVSPYDHVIFYGCLFCTLIFVLGAITAKILISGTEPLSYQPLGNLKALFWTAIFMASVMAGTIPMIGEIALEKWVEKRFKKIFSCSDFTFSRWIQVLADEMKYEGNTTHWDPYLYQQRVNRILSILARNFLEVADKKNPSDVRQIKYLKEKFWEAHNLAWALGFSVRPKVRDYAKEVE